MTIHCELFSFFSKIEEVQRQKTFMTEAPISRTGTAAGKGVSQSKQDQSSSRVYTERHNPVAEVASVLSMDQKS